jgi:hypothetical protein
MGFGYGLTKHNFSDDSSAVTVSVHFVAHQNSKFIKIVVSVDDVPSPTVETIKSPWTKVVPLKKGQTVKVVATQTTATKLSCAVNGDVQETTTFPGSVTCIHKRV